MKNKRFLTGAISLALVAVVSVGATLAYFTDKTETAENVFTTGKVKIELIDRLPGDYEATKDDHTWKAVDNGDNSGITYNEVLPGDYLQKQVGFSTAEDSNDCYVAIRVETEVTSLPHANGKLTEPAVAAQLSDLIREQVEEMRGDSWIAEYSVREPGVVTYYFRTVVPAGTENVLLFDGIQIPGEEWGNEYADMAFNVKVQAAAIQAANTTLDTLMDMSWDELTSLE